MTKKQELEKELKDLNETLNMTGVTEDEKVELRKTMEKVKEKLIEINEKPKTTVNVKKAAPNKTEKKQVSDLDYIENAQKKANIKNMKVSEKIKVGLLTIKNKTYEVIQISDPVKKKKAVTKRPSLNAQHSKLITKRIPDVFRPCIHELSKTKKDKEENKDKISEATKLQDLMTIFISELDVNVLYGDVSTIKKLNNMIADIINNTHKSKLSGRKEIQKIVAKYPSFFNVEEFGLGGVV